MKKCLILALGCSVLLLGGKVEAETKNQTAVDTKLEMKKVIPSNKKSENIDDVLQKMFSQLPEKEISSNKLEVSPRTTRGKTQKDAINWLNDSVGKMYGNGQCVFLAKEYIRWLSGAEVDGHGKEYINKIPSGWKRIYNTADFIPQAGDIMVWDGNQYGHVAVAAEGSTINKYNAYHQNYNADNKGSAVQKWNNQPYNPQGLRFVGVVRPDWTVPKITNGMFVKSPTRHEVYYISEGRRFYVPTWQSVGGQKKVETFSQAEIDRIPNGIANVPDGAFIQEWSDGTVYMLQKGVKIPLSNWKLVGGSHSYTKVPDGTLKNLKQGVENLPDGTLVREWDVNRVYMLQKGVKIYLTDWNLIGGVKPTSKLPNGALKNIKEGVQNLPDGTLVREWDVNRVYMLQKGVKIYLTDWSLIGGVKPTSKLPNGALKNIKEGVQNLPDGTLVREWDVNRVYMLQKGVKIYLTDWNLIGGVKPTSKLPNGALKNIKEGVQNLPDGTLVREWDVNRVYMLQKGVKIYLTDWNLIGGVKPTSKLPNGALKNIKEGVQNLPDGTLVREWDVNRVYMLQKGIKIYLTDWKLIGGVKPTSKLPNGALKNIKEGAKNLPNNIYVREWSDHRVYYIHDGVKQYLTSWNKVGGVKPVLILPDTTLNEFTTGKDI